MKMEEMSDEQKAALMKQFDEALAPVLHELEVGILELSRWIEWVMTQVWNAVSPPLDWLFNDVVDADAASPTP